MEPSLFEKTELGDFQAINDPKTTLSELEKSAQERIYLKLVEEIERITSSCNPQIRNRPHKMTQRSKR